MLDKVYWLFDYQLVLVRSFNNPPIVYVFKRVTSYVLLMAGTSIVWILDGVDGVV